jgi:uncharacterized membrane protein YkoI
MKRTGLVVAIAMLAAGVAYAGQPSATAQKKAAEKKAEKTEAKDEDQKTSLSKLPPAVRATVEAESKGATVKGISSEKENGKTVYELETLVSGRTRDLMIDSAGKVYVVEEQLDVDKAPAPVRAALEAKEKIVTLESVMQDGKTTYEGQVQTKAGKKIAVEVDASGKPIKP